MIQEPKDTLSRDVMDKIREFASDFDPKYSRCEYRGNGIVRTHYVDGAQRDAPVNNILRARDHWYRGE